MEDKWKMALHRANLILWTGLIAAEYFEYREAKKAKPKD